MKHSAAARLLCAVAFTSHSATGVDLSTDGLQPHVVFSEYSPLTRSSELARRFLSPLQAHRLAQRLRSSNSRLREQPIDLADERFTLYVPTQASEGGYSLLAFVPPGESATVPFGWKRVLDRHHMIFVSAERSGNKEDIAERREPLAILAAVNVMSRYRINADQVYVSGFSGGSRIALRVAVAYPDLFHGALLNSGSDPIGDSTFPLPPSELFATFQESSELVYLSGEDDGANASNDAGSIASMQKWCVFHVHAQSPPHTGHSVATPEQLDRALIMLSLHAASDPERLQACRQHIEQEGMQLSQEIDRSLDAGHLRTAQKLIQDFDVHYGGLSAPRVIALQTRLEELLKSNGRDVFSKVQ